MATQSRVRRRRNRDIHSALLSWYRTHGRSLPWRSTSNPYRILLAEVMLQQTQVQRVLALYPRFLKRFPTVRSLSAARQRSVVLAWQGMGYNNRAVRLHRLARTLTRHYGGRVPASCRILLSLPGIGRYTASAVLAFAFRRPVPVLDVNVRRVLSRVFWRMPSTAHVKSEKDIWKFASALLPSHRAYDWNQALMDLGAMVCTARTPHCGECPLARICLSHTTMRHSVPQPRNAEPAFAGIPRRIYRGRVIEKLRSLPKERPLSTQTLRQTVSEAGNPLDGRWFSRLLAGLEKDGLIRLRRKPRARLTMVYLA
jgi:A/G-specific adenine glycosylase